MKKNVKLGFIFVTFRSLNPSLILQIKLISDINCFMKNVFFFFCENMLTLFWISLDLLLVYYCYQNIHILVVGPHCQHPTTFVNLKSIIIFSYYNFTIEVLHFLLHSVTYYQVFF